MSVKQLKKQLDSLVAEYETLESSARIVVAQNKDDEEQQLKLLSEREKDACYILRLDTFKDITSCIPSGAPSRSELLSSLDLLN